MRMYWLCIRICIRLKFVSKLKNAVFCTNYHCVSSFACILFIISC